MLKRTLLLVCFTLAVGLSGGALGGKVRSYDVHYVVKLFPKKDYALVTIDIADASLLKRLDFRVDKNIHTHIKANGELELSDSSARWLPPKRNAKFQLRAEISHQRKNGGFDAMMTSDWAIFRGDDLVPPVKVKATRGASSKSYLSFDMPRGWHTVNTGWERDKSVAAKGKQRNAPHFFIDNPERRFDRPTGWMIAGKVGTRRAQVGSTRISVSAPSDTLFHRMDVLTYLNFLWPHIEQAFVRTPVKLLIVGGDDPMWRGGLSASNSLFMHADRPLVSENGTSTLVHEVVHMVTRIRGKRAIDDWIAEGLAEFYSIELLFRAGGIGSERRQRIKQTLQDWSKDVKDLQVERSSGAVTARAALLFYALDEELQKKTSGKHDIDDLVQILMPQKKVSVGDLRSACAVLVGSRCATLDVLNKP